MKQAEILAHATHVNGCEPAVYVSFMSQNFRLFHVSNLSVRNFLISLLMCPGSLCLSPSSPSSSLRLRRCRRCRRVRWDGETHPPAEPAALCRCVPSPKLISSAGDAPSVRAEWLSELDMGCRRPRRMAPPPDQGTGGGQGRVNRVRWTYRRNLRRRRLTDLMMSDHGSLW